MWKTGHSNIKQKMSDLVSSGHKALLGGELSGHIFFRDRFYGFDDAVYVSSRVLEILSRSDQSLSGFMKGLPDLYTTRELAINCPDKKKSSVISNLEEIYKSKGYNILDIDGVRINFDLHKWALVRASNTQPKLTARFQARSKEGLEEIVSLVRKELVKYEFLDISDIDDGLNEVAG
jgi:phosphomannomutase/phosphoglucomutase